MLLRGSKTLYSYNLSCRTFLLSFWTLWSLRSNSPPDGATCRPPHHNCAGFYGWFWAGSQQLHRAHQGLVIASPRQTPCPRAVHQMKRLWSTARHLSYHALAQAAAETEPNCRAHPPTRRSLSLAHRASAQWPDAVSPFWAGRPLVDLDDSAINESIFKVRVFTYCFGSSLLAKYQSSSALQIHNDHHEKYSHIYKNFLIYIPQGYGPNHPRNYAFFHLSENNFQTLLNVYPTTIQRPYRVWFQQYVGHQHFVRKWYIKNSLLVSFWYKLPKNFFIKVFSGRVSIELHRTQIWDP